MTSTRFWWIRHAVIHSGGKIYGQGDPPADCGDVDAFAGLARMVPDGAVWIATPLQRTQQTARAIWAQMDARELLGRGGCAPPPIAARSNPP